MTKGNIISLLLPLAVGGVLMEILGAFAQPISPPSEAALQRKLSQEINEGIACNTAAIDLQRQLADARKQIEELKKPKDDK